ncbi:MAG TPA: DUF4157 domain-containing protein [Chthoniobacterales bacterium]
MTFATLQNSGRTKRLPNAKKHTPRLSAQATEVEFPIIQAKLRIGAPNDRYEQEADRVAEQVMRMPDSEPEATFPSAHPASPPRVQRKCTACSVSGKLCPDCEKELQRQPDDKQEEESEIHPVRTIATDEDLLLAAKADSPSRVPMRTETVDGIAALRGGGRPLPPEERNFMELRFGRDFGNVRIHTGPRAESLARQIRAQAFTLGDDIAFGAGRFQPEQETGRRLLAHELTHTIQQSGAAARLGGQRLIQRAVCENVPPPSGMTCLPGLVSSGAPTVETIQFGLNGSTLSPTDESTLESFLQRWHNAGATDPVRVDGFASCDGKADANWMLSCARADAVAAVLIAPPSGTRGVPPAMLEVFANGETDQFSTNRVVTISTNTPLGPPVSREPSILSWSTHSSSGTTAADNCCTLCPQNVGVGAVAGWLGNGIEHQALILDHDPAYSYDVKRTMDHRVWQRRTVFGVGFWANIASQPAGTPDDSHDQDECLTPVLPVAGNPYVYVWDGPGFMPPSPGDTSTDYVNITNFTEFVRITRPDGTTYDDPLTHDWHTKTWISRAGAVWSVDVVQSSIGTGHLGSLNP